MSNPTLQDFDARHMLRHLPPQLAAFCEKLMGREPDMELFNVDGIALGDGLALVRSDTDIRYLFAMLMAGTWFYAFTVPAYDDFVTEWRHKFTEIGKPPEAEQKRAEIDFESMTDSQKREAFAKMGMNFIPSGTGIPGPRRRSYRDISII